MNSVAILVVTYNRKEMLVQNIKAMLQQTYREFDYYVMDNASTDGTEQLIQELIQSDSRFHYKKLNKNYGGAGGFYYGLKYILNHEYQYSWIMDDDAIPEPDSLEKILQAADQIGMNQFSYLASQVLWTDGNPCLMNVCHEVKGKQETNYSYPQIDYSSFVGCLVNNKVAKKIGLPIPEFFIYMDDTEYTLRLSGTRPAYLVKTSKIIHKMPSNSTAGIETAPLDKLPRFRYAYRNRIYCYRYRWQMNEIKIIILYILESLRVLRAHPKHQWKRIGIIWKGYKEGLKFKPDIRYIDEGREN